MARVVIKQSQIRNLENLPEVQRIVNNKAQAILEAAKRLAPRDTGALSDSLSVVNTQQRGKKIVRIVSNDPQIREILKGTRPGYKATPPFGTSSALGGWGGRHGFTTFPSRRRLARKIMVVGTLPAGSSTGNADWLQNAIREGINR